MPLSGDFVTRFKCPYCDADTPSTILYQIGDGQGRFFHLARCMNQGCERYVFFVYEGDTGYVSIPGNQNISVNLIHQFPTKEGTTHQSIPQDIAESYKQGVRCFHANAPIGAVTCFRRALQQICKDQDTTKEKLNDQIDEVIPDPLKDIAHEIRSWGNFGAHPDLLITDVTNGDAEEMKDFIDSVFDTMYVTPHRVQERKNRRQSN